MAKYIYPGVFTPEDGGYSVNFPDIQGCYTCGDNLQDAIEMAKDVLAFSIYSIEKNNQTIPKSSNITEIQANPNEFVNYIICDTFEYKKKNNKQPVRRMVSLPAWLDELAKEKSISLSKTLQESLSQKLGVTV